MGGRYRSENEGVVTRAARNNCWIRLNKRKWLTPDEFYHKFGHEARGLKPEQIEILNPMPYLYSGRKVIEQMIQDKKPVSSIMNALARLFEFEDKIRQEGYKPRQGQVNCVSWPLEKEPAARLGDRQVKKKEPPPDYNDLQYSGMATEDI